MNGSYYRLILTTMDASLASCLFMTDMPECDQNVSLWSMQDVPLDTLQRLDGLPIERSHQHVLREQPIRAEILEVIKNPSARTALEAGLWLWIDELEHSHKASQSREGDKTCDAWHAIMHRRKGDFGNARYWVRRAGAHPSHAHLWNALKALDPKSLSAAQAPIYNQILVQGSWRGDSMVELCERYAHQQEGEEGLLLRTIQQMEMLHLMSRS